jgi:hypothetical protein
MGGIVVNLPRGLGFSVAYSSVDFGMKFSCAALHRAKLQCRVRAA